MCYWIRIWVDIAIRPTCHGWTTLLMVPVGHRSILLLILPLPLGSGRMSQPYGASGYWIHVLLFYVLVYCHSTITPPFCVTVLKVIAFHGLCFAPGENRLWRLGSAEKPDAGTGDNEAVERHPRGWKPTNLQPGSYCLSGHVAIR